MTIFKIISHHFFRKGFEILLIVIDFLDVWIVIKAVNKTKVYENKYI